MNAIENQQKYGPLVAPLLTVNESMTLARGKPDEKAGASLKSLSSQSMFPGETIRRKEMAQLCLSGLWLLHGYLDESHAISQAIKTDEGSYWHGLMHRREPDFPNAKFWLSRVAYHPVTETLGEKVPSMVRQADLDFSTAFLSQQDTWNADSFVDLCQAVLMGKSEGSSICLRVAALEWELLFDYCYRGAVGKL
jgi:hypothetical protein